LGSAAWNGGRSREVATLTLEHTWDGRTVDMIDAGKKKAAQLATQF
jgi:FMN-dependent NADH-azoreductase